MHCCRKHELGPKQIFGNSHFLILGMKCLQKQNILQDQPVHGSLNMILLQRLSIFIYQYTSPFERNLGRLTLNSKKMADICLRFTHFINIAYHVIPSSVIDLENYSVVWCGDYKKALNPQLHYKHYQKVKVGNDQEMAQSERNSHSETRVGKHYENLPMQVFKL